jgi:hypothetical protein
MELEKNAKPLVVEFVDDGEEQGLLTISWDDEAIKIEAARIDEAVTGPVKLVVH